MKLRGWGVGGGGALALGGKKQFFKHIDFCVTFCPFCSGDRLADKLPLLSVSCSSEDARRRMLHEPDLPASVLVKEV
jgi:hypothetical protein